MELTAEPEGLNVLSRLFAVWEEDNTLFGVGFNPLMAQLIQEVGTAFLCFAKRQRR